MNKRRLRDKIIRFLLRILFGQNKGFYILSEPWDYLIILDACRYDVFRDIIKKYNLNGKLEYRISRGSNTVEFLLENFGKGYFQDIVYVTANPYVDLLLKNKFYRIISVWKYGWNEELNTVHPKEVYKYALDAIINYPDKRFIIHFMQPHYPFITAKEIKTTGINRLRHIALRIKNTNIPSINIWKLVAKGVVSLDYAKLKYRENLEVALNYVVKLIQHLHGKIIITSDHGEGFGEKIHPLIPKRVYGHLAHVRIEPLVKVPWYIIEKPGIGKHLKTRAKLRRKILKLRQQI